MSVPTPDEIAAAKASFLDFPTAWKIQREVGASLKHHPRCSSVPGWDPISGPAFLCDCGAVELEWHRRGRRVLLAALEQAEAKLAESERQRERLMEGDTYQAVLELDARLEEIAKLAAMHECGHNAEDRLLAFRAMNPAIRRVRVSAILNALREAADTAVAQEREAFRDAVRQEGGMDRNYYGDELQGSLFAWLDARSRTEEPK